MTRRFRGTQKGQPYLEDMEAFILDHFPIIFEEVHAQFEMLPSIHVCRHDGVVRSVEQNLAQQFYRLPFRNV